MTHTHTHKVSSPVWQELAWCPFQCATCLHSTALTREVWWGVIIWHRWSGGWHKVSRCAVTVYFEITTWFYQVMTARASFVISCHICARLRGGFVPTLFYSMLFFLFFKDSPSLTFLQRLIVLLCNSSDWYPTLCSMQRACNVFWSCNSLHFSVFP